MNYPLADFLIRIKNGYMARARKVELPYSKYIESIAQILVKEGYLKSVEKTVDEGKSALTAELLYKDRRPALNNVTIVSKPSLHKYASKTQVKKMLHEYGMSIISTSNGVMTSKTAAEKNLGGEIVCKIQ